MPQKIKIVILFITFLYISALVSTANGQKKRNLNNYIKGPTFSYMWSLSEKEEEELRQYIWDTWNKKQQVYFYFSFVTREGTENISVYYFEKDKNNSWRIVRKFEKGQCSYISKKACQKYFAREDIYDKVEKVQDKNRYSIVLSNSSSKNKEKIEF
jgi:hypothetical protein